MVEVIDLFFISLSLYPPSSLVRILKLCLCFGRSESKGAQYVFFKLMLITDNYLLLMADPNKMSNNFIFLYFKNKFINCSFCTTEGKKG